jgi:hypothetical protein
LNASISLFKLKGIRMHEQVMMLYGIINVYDSMKSLLHPRVISTYCISEVIIIWYEIKEPNMNKRIPHYRTLVNGFPPAAIVIPEKFGKLW